TITGLALPQLHDAGALLVSDNPDLAALSVGSLGTVGGSLTVTNNVSLLGSVGLDSLGSVGGSLTVQQNSPTLSGVTAPQLGTVGGNLVVETQGQTSVAIQVNFGVCLDIVDVGSTMCKFHTANGAT